MVTTKSKEEISILREGGKRHAFILRELGNMVKPGVSALDLENRARELIALGGDKSAFLNFKPYGSKRPYPASLCVSINDEIVHGIPNESEKIFKDGDTVSLDLGLIHKGLYTDAAITVPVGKISDQARQLIENTEKALYAGISAVKNGKKTGDIGEAISRIAFVNKYGVVEELVGHGVGYSAHEDPYVPNYGMKGQGDPLTTGMVIAIEPIFNLGTKKIKLDADGYTFKTADGSLSAHFEHTVVITKSGAEILTA